MAAASTAAGAGSAAASAAAASASTAAAVGPVAATSSRMLYRHSCPACKQQGDHVIVYSCHVLQADPDVGIWSNIQQRMICLNCRRLWYRAFDHRDYYDVVTTQDSEDGPETLEQARYYKIYEGLKTHPDRDPKKKVGRTRYNDPDQPTTHEKPFEVDSKHFTIEPALRRLLPDNIAWLLLEVEQAAFNDSWRLWTVGLRMLVEALTVHLKIQEKHGQDPHGREFPLTLPQRIRFLCQHLDLKNHASLCAQAGVDFDDAEFAKLEEICKRMTCLVHHGNHAAHSDWLAPPEDRASLFSLIKIQLWVLFGLPDEFRQHQDKINLHHAAAMAVQDAPGRQR